MTESSRDSERSRRGRRLLRWLAPITSIGLLGYLVARVSSCEPPATSSQPLKPEPRLNTAALEVDIARPPIDAGRPHEAATETPQQALGRLMGGYLGGSKSGFGGLGLRGSRVDTDAAVPSLADVPGPHGRSLEFLGTSKAPPRVISDSLAEPRHHDEQEAQPAQQGSTP